MLQLISQAKPPSLNTVLCPYEIDAWVCTYSSFWNSTKYHL